MKVASVIVTFNPDIPQFRRVLDSVSDQVSNIKVIDNGSANIKDIRNLIDYYADVELIPLNENFGIAKAQNVGFQELESLAYDWVLTLDQDTVIPTDYIERLIINTDLKDAAIITGAYIDVKWNESEINSIRVKRKPAIQSISEEISSGNLVLVRAWREIGCFDEQLFIDYVDFDFDYRLAEFGYQIYRVNNVEFMHEIGSPVKKGFFARMLFLNKHEVFDHSAFRMFYLFRNRLIVRKRHPQFGSPIRMFIREVLNLREILIMEGPRFQKMQAAVHGIIKGITGK
ncbi:glycosyltransferase [Lactiplantibacillus pentosus]|uniref:glycosyltransferase n=1 Tax=Lactiplantibacillus pentosus TaxID=1589 RepID=UPI0021A80615|nr:glycosyltransferase [Lactiplantibacillus pentosus]MCT3064587.1 glycosyltransferase [Lactiplantibacillus pentosus]